LSSYLPLHFSLDVERAMSTFLPYKQYVFGRLPRNKRPSASSRGSGSKLALPSSSKSLGSSTSCVPLGRHTDGVTGDGVRRSTR
jgi:hypothetical protein